MTYSAEISRVNPTCFLFLIDQSGSMAESWGGESGKTKAQGVADAINRLLQTLVPDVPKATTSSTVTSLGRSATAASRATLTRLAWASPFSPWRKASSSP